MSFRQDREGAQQWEQPNQALGGHAQLMLDWHSGGSGGLRTRCGLRTSCHLLWVSNGVPDMIQ